MEQSGFGDVTSHPKCLAGPMKQNYVGFSEKNDSENKSFGERWLWVWNEKYISSG